MKTQGLTRPVNKFYMKSLWVMQILLTLSLQAAPVFVFATSAANDQIIIS